MLVKCWSNWIISPGIGMNIKKYLKPPPIDKRRSLHFQMTHLIYRQVIHFSNKKRSTCELPVDPVRRCQYLKNIAIFQKPRRTEQLMPSKNPLRLSPGRAIRWIAQLRVKNSWCHPRRFRDWRTIKNINCFLTRVISTWFSFQNMATLRSPAKSKTLSGLHIKSH